jgi:acyl dehydratase
VSTVTLKLEELEGRVGQEIAVSPWYRITQEQIDRFADATEDHQWIHVDRERARSSPFGGTIAHGFLTLSILPKLVETSFRVADRKMGVNYGLNKLRFTAPVPSGSNVRARFTLGKYERLEGGAQLTWKVTVEREGGDKPCLVAEWLIRQYG